MTQSNKTRPALTRERVIQAAIDVADSEGLNAVTMRRLGTELGVEAMSLYKHVSNKNEIKKGIVEFVISEIEIDADAASWIDAMRGRAISARDVLRRHSWAIGLMEERGLFGPVVMGYVNSTIGAMRSSGISVGGAAHAFWLLDSYIYGHIVQESSSARSSQESEDDETNPDDYPHLVELQAFTVDYGFTFDGEFEFGLELILDALERRFADDLG